jgi:hypothetical protein
MAVVVGVASVQMRAYFSSYHLWAAEHFAWLAQEAESQPGPVFKIQHRAYVTNAVLSAVAFLEASINEVFDDVADGHPSYVASLSDDTKRLLGGLWTGHESVERWRILDKYGVALLCAGKPFFDKGAQPYQDASLLVRLRNRLIHARPKTRESGDTDTLELCLSTRFSSNRLMANMANPYFPDKCLGAACSEWAVLSARAFADEFFSRLGTRPNYQAVDFGPP